MTTFTKGNKNISICFGEIKVEADNTVKDAIYTITAPKITCNNESDAILIKDEVNKFVNTLVKNLLKEKE